MTVSLSLVLIHCLYILRLLVKRLHIDCWLISFDRCVIVIILLFFLFLFGGSRRLLERNPNAAIFSSLRVQRFVQRLELYSFLLGYGRVLGIVGVRYYQLKAFSGQSIEKGFDLRFISFFFVRSVEQVFPQKSTKLNCLLLVKRFSFFLINC